MKQFANEKEGPKKKSAGGLDQGVQNARQDKKNHEFGGFGSAGGNGYANPMEAARFGHPGAIAMLQSGGARLERKGPRPIPGHLVVKAQRLRGVDLSGVTLEEDPALAEQAKRGFAEDGQRIRLAPGGLSDMTLIWHEIVHLVQQQKAQADGGGAGGGILGVETAVGGGAEGATVGAAADGGVVGGRSGGGEPSGGASESGPVAEQARGAVDPELEAKTGSAALAGGSAVEVAGQATGPMYSDEPESESEGAHGEFQGNESGAVCTSGEDSDSGQTQPVAEAAKAAEVVEIPKGLQEFFDEPAYEFGEDGRVLAASPEAEGVNPEAPGPSREITAAELNQAIAALERMRDGEREVYLVVTGRKAQNPATVVSQTEAFLDLMETQQVVSSGGKGVSFEKVLEQLITEKAILSSILADAEVELNSDDQAQIEIQIREIDEVLNQYIVEGPNGPILLHPRDFLTQDSRPDLANIEVCEANMTTAFGTTMRILAAASVEAVGAEEAAFALTLLRLAPVATTASGPGGTPVSYAAEIELASKILTVAALGRMLEFTRDTRIDVTVEQVEIDVHALRDGSSGPSGSPRPSGPNMPAGLLLAGTVATAGAVLGHSVAPSPQKGLELPNERDGKETTDGKEGAEAEAQLGFARTAEEVEKDGYLTKPPGPDERRPIPIESDADLPTNALSAEASGEKGDLLPSQRRHIDRIDNATEEHAKESDFAAVELERRGVSVGTNPKTGKPWDHIKEMRQTRRVLNTSKRALKNSLGSPDHSSDTRNVVQQAIDKASPVIERMDHTLNDPIDD